MHIFRVLAENWWPQIAPKVLTHSLRRVSPHLDIINNTVHHQFYCFLGGWWGGEERYIRNGRLAS